jgi:hypothetical protein
MGVSRATAHKWVRRWRAEGEEGLADRSSRPRTTPHRTPAAVEARVCRLRQTRKLRPARLGPILDLPASTVHRILVRHGLNRLAHLDRPTGQVIRRYERDRPGELLHVDVKKLGRIPDGGGHKMLGRQAGRATRSKMGFDYVHSAVDDHSRLAHSEVHADEKAVTCAGFLRRAAAFFHAAGIDRIERILTDNAWLRVNTPRARPADPRSAGAREAGLVGRGPYGPRLPLSPAPAPDGPGARRCPAHGVRRTDPPCAARCGSARARSPRTGELDDVGLEATGRPAQRPGEPDLPHPQGPGLGVGEVMDGRDMPSRQQHQPAGHRGVEAVSHPPVLIGHDAFAGRKFVEPRFLAAGVAGGSRHVPGS